MTPEHEIEIYLMHKRAAELAIEAAETRLQTAKAEQECAFRTLQMADAVAQSMYLREVGPVSG